MTLRTEPSTTSRRSKTASPTALDSHLLRIIAAGDRPAETPAPGVDRRRADRYRALGGQIWARPRDGGGAEVGFTLPLASDPP